MLDDTLIIITSDHGEQLGQHGLYGHAGLHESVVKIPLIMRLPDRLPQGLRVKGYAQQVDIVPTILDLAQIETNYRFDGVSLLELIKGRRIRDYAVVETWGERAIIDGDWKLIVHYEKEFKEPGVELKMLLDEVKPIPYKGVRIELYNIRDDPMEVINLVERKDKVDELLEKLERWIRDHLEEGEADPMEILDRYLSPQPVEWQKR
ncbi:MAG: hypothetical protein DRJ49_07415 [Thermoprotei archaeon]|nr:MAG: hypothetical protein DRJ49_07415 [Thermoprotei archaeon]